MPVRIIQRPATAQELAKFAEWCALGEQDDGCFRREYRASTWRMAGVFFVSFGSCWLVIAPRLAEALNFESGFASPMALSGLGIVTVVFVAYALRNIRRYNRAVEADQDDLRADIETRTVQEEHFLFTGAKCFYDPKDGVRTWFLRTDDSRTLALYDPEGVKLAEVDLDGSTSTFHPLTELVLVRGPRTLSVLDQRFSGAPLLAETPLAYAVESHELPFNGDYCDIPWDELEVKFSQKS